MYHFHIGENIKINDEVEEKKLEIYLTLNGENTNIKNLRYDYHGENNFSGKIKDENIFNSIITNMKVYSNLSWDNIDSNDISIKNILDIIMMMEEHINIFVLDEIDFIKDLEEEIDKVYISFLLYISLHIVFCDIIISGNSVELFYNFPYDDNVNIMCSTLIEYINVYFSFLSIKKELFYKNISYLYNNFHNIYKDLYIEGPYIDFKENFLNFISTSLSYTFNYIEYQNNFIEESTRKTIEKEINFMKETLIDVFHHIIGEITKKENKILNLMSDRIDRLERNQRVLMDMEKLKSSS